MGVKVYILTCDCHYETRNIANVYSSRKAAEAELKEHETKWPRCLADSHEVEEHEVIE